MALNKDDGISQVNNLFPDNISGEITPADLRVVSTNAISSSLNTEEVTDQVIKSNFETTKQLIKHAPGWRDMFGSFTNAKITGTNEPTWTKVVDDGAGSTGVYAYAFSPTVLNELWVMFQVDHDFAIGTAFYPHIHWLPDNVDTGVVRWGIEWSAAQSHSQDVFGNTFTIFIEETASGVINQHMLAEVADPGITVPGAEPGMIILARVFRDATHANDTFTGNAIGLNLDAHFQVDRDSTLNKEPPFYT